MTDAMTPDAVPPTTDQPAAAPSPTAPQPTPQSSLPGAAAPSSPTVSSAWAPAAAPQVLPSGPREYPQALRGPRHRWWRPLVGLAAVTVGVIVVFGAMLLYALVWIVAQALGTQLPDPGSVTDAWFVSPAGLLVTNLGLALGIPLALVATWAQARRAGLVSSVLGRVRWRLLLGGLGMSLLLLVPLTIGTSILMALLGAPDAGAGAGSGADEAGLWPLTPASGWLVLALVILLTTPLQAAGEEYFFRGWLTQWIGSMLRRRWVAVLVPAAASALLFAMAHGAQSPWLFADRLVFGLVASLLVWRTGGLEVAVALHAANNLVAFGLAIAYDGLQDSLLITEVAPSEGAVSIGVTLVTTVALLWWARRRRPTLVVTDPVPVVGPVVGPVTGPVEYERAKGETA
ncbi:type II CAAX endopeptidase family protein [Promicromonospora sp. MEB111]|uniref:CPBP family intramembrane glutamic endopeptidase n=1 Tax=Promicromonospora sp. MEB111 TaxID=3040301 RepID=UPI002550AECF|nr:type II CAAX endopeptidase family protein [Promicromonospora sp. MEB111]